MGFVDEYHNKYQTGGLQHLLAGQIRQEVGNGRFDNYFKFSVVRNPFDRLVSQFAYMRHRRDLRAFIGMPLDASFEEYLDLIGRRRHVQWEPQCSFLYDEDGTLLLDYVGRFETLASDMEAAFERLGIRGANLPHIKRGDRGPYREYYTGRARGLVEERYGQDLERLAYEF